MSGIRVKAIPKKCQERDLKIYFSKPENGGGPIQKLYYPLFDNDAVIIFEDQDSKYVSFDVKIVNLFIT